MSKWEQYKVEQFQPNQGQQTSKWEQYKIQNPQSQPKEYSVGNRAASAGKAIAAGVGGAIPDTAALAYNLPATLHNALARHNQNLPEDVKKAYAELVQHDPKYAKYLDTKEIPTIPSATEALDRGIDHITGGYTETPEDQKNLNEGLKFASSFATGGGIAKVGATLGNKAISKAGNFMGSLEKSQIAGAGAAGATSSYLADQGASAPESIAGGVAANLAVNSLPTGGNLLAKGTLALTGLGKKQLNLDAAKAAQDLDIVLPKAVVSEGKAIAYADRFLNHAPFAGNIMQKRYARIGEKALEELDKAYESVISSKELVGIEDRITGLYEVAKETLPKDAQIVPKNTIKAIEEIRDNISAPALSGDFATINAKLNQIQKEFSPGYIKGIPAKTKTLVNQKENLNNSIYNDLKTDKGRKILGDLNDAIRNDLAEYGKTNPEWYNYFTKADGLHSKKSTRKTLEKLLSGKAESYTTGELTYNSLSKVLNTPESKDQLKHLVKPEIFDRLEKLGTVSQAMAKKNKGTINPSGTAVAQTTINWISGLAGLGGYKVGALDFQTAVLSTIGATGLAHLLTDKKTLDFAIKFAETGGEKAALGFNQRMKVITGYTPVTLMREASKLEQEKQVDNPNVIEISNPLKKHTEENKKRPKGQALNELLENPYVNGFGKSLSNPWPQK
jgi:hypothetical protein